MRKKSHIFKNLVCLITGGAQGIGWATALMLADEGAKVFICDVSSANLEKAFLQLKDAALENDMHLSQCDVSDSHAVNRWVEMVYQREGRLDIVINNANFIQWGLASEIPINVIEKMMRVGYIGALNVMKTVLPIMQALGRGHIINIGSAAGKLFVGGVPAPYSAAKAAMDAYTQALQLELKQKKSPVCLSLIRLGTVGGTDFFRQEAGSYQYMPRFADFVPPLTPPAVAKAISMVIKKRKRMMNVPSYLRIFYFIFEIAPGFFHFLMKIGGQAQRDYGKIAWEYRPRNVQTTRRREE